MTSTCMYCAESYFTHSVYQYSPAFVEEFTELLSIISSEFDCFGIAGDFNIHIDNAEIKLLNK